MLWQKKERGNKNLERVNCEEEQVLKVVGERKRSI
jgi:hypothetical protein